MAPARAVVPATGVPLLGPAVASVVVSTSAAAALVEVGMAVAGAGMVVVTGMEVAGRAVVVLSQLWQTAPVSFTAPVDLVWLEGHMHVPVVHFPSLKVHCGAGGAVDGVVFLHR